MVLVLVGVIGSVGTFGLTTFIKNFTISKQGTDTTSAGQMAMLRIAKELIAVSAANDSASETDGSKIRFTSNHGGTDRFLKLELSGTDLNLIEYADDTTTTATSTDLLAADVSSLSLQYYDWVADNDTLAISPTTTWNVKPCSFVLPETNFNKSNCDIQDRQRIEFTAPTDTYIIYYGGNEYYTCLGNGLYKASGAATLTSPPQDCGGTIKGWIDEGLPYYDEKFYVYPADSPECFLEFSFEDNDCSVQGDIADNPEPSGGAASNWSSLIEVNLLMEGLSDPFTIRVAPRNI